MRLLHIAFALVSATAAQAYEINGRIFDEEDGHPLAGAVIRLKARGDSALTDSAGAYRFDFDRTGLRPSGGRRAALPARIRAGALEYRAEGGEEARIDLFGTDGKRAASLRHRPASPGLQRVSLAPFGNAPRGLGWIRIRAGGRTECIRTLSLGGGLEASAPASGSALASGAALGKAAAAIVDTLRVERQGYYPVELPVTDTLFHPGQYTTSLYRNRTDSVAPAELEAWKDHLARPVLAIRVAPSSITLPAGLETGALELADGSEAPSWSTARCQPGPRPKSVRLAYTRDGHAYRDTVPLAPIWALLDSYRITEVDTLGLSLARFHLAWDWPKGFSSVPERDWMEAILKKRLVEDVSVSHPDVFRRGVQRGSEGGTTRYEAFDPARGTWAMKSELWASLGLRAEFTLARREGHDLRIALEYPPGTGYDDPVRFFFLNDWPEGGRLRPDQILDVRVRADPAAPFVMLKLIPEGQPKGVALKRLQGGTDLRFSFPIPVRDSLAFRLGLTITDELGAAYACFTPAFSPVLRIVTPASDTVVNAYEPNESSRAAAPVPTGRWIDAAWDLRASGEPDVDCYRFQAEAGATVRLSVRNPNLEEIEMRAAFSIGSDAIKAASGEEKSGEFLVRSGGDQIISVSPSEFPAGRYSFRIDIVP